MVILPQVHSPQSSKMYLGRSIVILNMNLNKNIFIYNIEILFYSCFLNETNHKNESFLGSRLWSVNRLRYESHGTNTLVLLLVSFMNRIHCFDSSFRSSVLTQKISWRVKTSHLFCSRSRVSLWPTDGCIQADDPAGVCCFTSVLGLQTLSRFGRCTRCTFTKYIQLKRAF